MNKEKSDGLKEKITLEINDFVKKFKQMHWLEDLHPLNGHWPMSKQMQCLNF